MKLTLHRTYYLLAILDVITIIITLFLAYGIYRTYEDSFQANQQWVWRSVQYDHLTDLAIQANGPGNDVFITKNIEKESKRLKIINRKVNELIKQLRSDAKQNLSHYPEIITRLNNFSSYLDQANTLTNNIFDLIQNKQLKEAGQYMARMDSRFHSSLLEISSLRNIVRQIQEDVLLDYHSKAQSIFIKELYVAVFILLLVVLIVYFGRKIKMSFDRVLVELDSNNSKLTDSEHKLRTVLNTILDAVVLIDDKGRIEYVNPQAERLFGYQFDEVKGRNVNIFMPEPYHSEHDRYIDAYLKTGKAKIIGSTREVIGKRKDGIIFPLELGISEVKVKDGIMFAGILKDISERKKSQMYLSNIATVQEMYINGESQDQIFDRILRFLLDYTGSQYGFIGGVYYDTENTPYLKTYAITNIAWNDETRLFYDENAPDGLEFRNLDTLFGHTLKTGEVVIANDPVNDPRAGGLPKGHPDMSSYMGLPIVGKEGLIAMYGMANREGGYNEDLVKDLNAITSVMTSIIESARSFSLIEKMANRDALTGAYNRFYFKSYVEEILRQRLHGENKKKFCIMMIDFNKFKHINDYHGHEYGDYVLKELVNRVVKKIKNEDLIARIGGDEFVILIDDMDDYTTAGKIASRIVDMSRVPYEFEGKKIECSVSIGIACFPISGRNIDELLRHADLALYRAKTDSMGYFYFSDELQDRYMGRQDLERGISNALSRGEFYFEYQPIVDCTSRKVIGGEALIRWGGSFGSTIVPSQFIPVMESMGLSSSLNNYVISCVMNQFKDVKLKRPVKLSINISPYMQNMYEDLRDLMSSFGDSFLADQVSLDFEITETSFMANNVDFRRGGALDKLFKLHNINLSLDDFGIEYSSINRLMECNFSSIKIDMSFVQKLDSPESESARIIVKAIIDIADGLGIDIIAEGAETERQFEILQKLGCKYVQGYYFYKPMPFSQFLNLLLLQN